MSYCGIRAIHAVYLPDDDRTLIAWNLGCNRRWFIGIAARRQQKAWPVITIGVLYAATLHGVYFVFASNFIGLLFAALTLPIFMFYLVHGAEGTNEQMHKTVVVTENSGEQDVSGK